MNEDYYHEQNPCYDSNSFGFDQIQPRQYTVNHLIFNAQNELLNSQNELFNSQNKFLNSQNKLMEQMTNLRDMFDQYVQKKEEEKRIEEEQAVKDRYWKIPICYDDDDDEESSIPLKDSIISGLPSCVAITPILLTKEPVNSLSIGDEHLDTISATKSDEVVKSSVKILIPIPSESEGVPEMISDSNDNSTSSDDDSFSIDDIEYVEASPPDSEPVSLEDDILRAKLLNVNLLIANIEALKDNPTPSSDFMTKSSFTFPNLFLEETNTFDNSLPESNIFCFNLEEISSGSPTTRSDYSLSDYETFYDGHIEEKSSGNTTTHSNFSLSKYDSFIFDLMINPFPPADRNDFHEEFAGELAHIISPPKYDSFFMTEPELGEFAMDVVGDIYPTREPRVHVPNVLPTHPTLDLNFILSSESLFAYVVWIFLPFLTYPVTPPYLLSCGNEDTIFDLASPFFILSCPHQSGTFMKFNGCPDCEASRARGFCPPITRASHPQLHLGIRYPNLID
ncbi:hypothetical protein Tco_1405065 [Tanacetum coccineum]